MYLECVRIVAAAWENATYGVNAQIAGVPREAGDAQPPNVADFLDETTDPSVARDEVPRELTDAGPVILTYMGGPLAMTGEVLTSFRGATEVEVFTRVCLRGTDIALAMRQALYYLRAMQRSLRALLANAQEAARTRNQVYLEECIGLEYAPAFEAARDNLVTGVLRMKFTARDLAP